MFSTHGPRRASVRVALLGSLAIVGVLVATPSVLAGRPDRVDPTIMQPPLSPEFAPWTCWLSAGHTICEGSKAESYAGLEVDFLACEVGPISSEGTFSSVARRTGDANGRALETSFRDRYEETFSIDSDGSGPTLRSIGRLQHTFSYGVAGDPSTVSETIAGMGISLTGPGFGVVLHDVGTIAWDSGGELRRIGGIHPPLFDEQEWQATHDRICAYFEPGS